MACSSLLAVLLLHLAAGATTASAGFQSDRNALLTLRANLHHLERYWNLTESHCKWTGVRCTYNKVTSLLLNLSSLSGQIPEGTIGGLTSVRTVELSENHISGPIPSDIGQATQLRYLGLDDNLLSGAIPPSISSLYNLVYLNLQFNRLSGPIPDLRLPRLTFFDVSLNNLTGPIPEGLSKWPGSSFHGNAGLCGKPLSACPVQPPPEP